MSCPQFEEKAKGGLAFLSDQSEPANVDGIRNEPVRTENDWSLNECTSAPNDWTHSRWSPVAKHLNPFNIAFIVDRPQVWTKHLRK